MEIIIYKAKANVLVLVPSCFLPSQEAERIHGPLQRHGRALVSDANPSKRWQAIAVEIERQAYAIITRAEAEHILVKRRRGIALAAPLEAVRIASATRLRPRSIWNLARLRAMNVPRHWHALGRRS